MPPPIPPETEVPAEKLEMAYTGLAPLEFLAHDVEVLVVEREERGPAPGGRALSPATSPDPLAVALERVGQIREEAAKSGQDHREAELDARALRLVLESARKVRSLEEALAAVTPYAESRAEDLQEELDQAEDECDGSTPQHKQQEAVAQLQGLRESAEKAWKAVQAAQALVPARLPSDFEAFQVEVIAERPRLVDASGLASAAEWARAVLERFVAGQSTPEWLREWGPRIGHAIGVELAVLERLGVPVRNRGSPLPEPPVLRLLAEGLRTAPDSGGSDGR